MVKEQNYFLQTGGIFACGQRKYNIATVIGTGVAVCLCDPIAKIGGVSHFTMPKEHIFKKKDKQKYMSKYGENSIPHLLSIMYKLGAKKDNINAHIVGGSDTPEHLQQMKNIGKKNVDTARKFLKKNKIKVISEDTHGLWGRKILFNPQSGEMLVYKLPNIRQSDWEN